MPAIRPASIHVSAPARLHLGFLDLNGSLGRRFGSLGVALDQPCYRLRILPAAGLSVSGPDAPRAERYVHLLSERLGWPDSVRITIEQAIPAHSGLGSGTQLALALGTGIARLFGIQTTSATIAGALDRGARSGIGIAAFEQGGFVLDGGRRGNKCLAGGRLLDGTDGQSLIPPILSRLPFPEHWRILLIFDRSRRGFSGGAERRAFTELPVFPEVQAAHLCHLTLMRALPALVEADITGFGTAISEIQRHVGDHFAPVQGGRFASPTVTATLDELARQGRTGLGQSSWGPTGFALCAGDADAAQLQAQLNARWSNNPDLRFVIAGPRNHSGTIEPRTGEPHRGRNPLYVTH